MEIGHQIRLYSVESHTTHSFNVYCEVDIKKTTYQTYIASKRRLVILTLTNG